MDFTDLTLKIAGVIITGLLVVIGYFLKRQIKAIETLSDLVSTLNTSAELLKNNQGNFSINCNTRHGLIDKRLNSHSFKIQKHEKELGIIQSKIK